MAGNAACVFHVLTAILMTVAYGRRSAVGPGKWISERVGVRRSVAKGSAR
jgi:hypothetical protein